MPSLRSRFYYLAMRYAARPRFKLDIPPEILRTGLEKSARWLRVPRDVRVERVSVEDIPAEWLVPTDAAAEQVLLYLHGGGYFMGSCRTHRSMVAYIARACRTRALLPDYRLAPEHPFPAALEDSTAIYRWLLEEGYAPRNIVIAGDSAGGGLTLTTLLALRDGGDPLPAAAICLSPWTDLAGTGESIRTRANRDPMLRVDMTLATAAYYIGEDEATNPLISPVYADLTGLPPLLIHVGNEEILLSDAVRLADRAREAGVDVTLEVWEQMWHVWHLLGDKMPESKRAIDEIAAFVGEKLGQTDRVAAV